ncbi:hypothetical protein Dimus_005439, partial [Dionaea muscipula]
NPRAEEAVEIQSPPRAPASSGNVGTFRVGSITENSPNSSSSSISGRFVRPTAIPSTIGTRRTVRNRGIGEIERGIVEIGIPLFEPTQGGAT